MYVTVIRNLPVEEANTIALVLESAGVSGRFHPGDAGVDITVDADYHETAIRTIHAYYEENAGDSSINQLAAAETVTTYSGIGIAVILAAVHVAIGPDNRLFVEHYGSSASEIVNGDVYRSLTSLFLHADAGHIAGNAFGIALFGTAVCAFTGTGVGWLMILMSGAMGNFLNAVLHQTDHVSIGASTAVFSAVGIAAGYQSIRRYKNDGLSFKSMLPLFAGAALLAFLGASPHSDLPAHLFGFGFGVLFGITYGFLFNSPAGPVFQKICLLLGLGLVFVSIFQGF